MPSGPAQCFTTGRALLGWKTRCAQCGRRGVRVTKRTPWRCIVCFERHLNEDDWDLCDCVECSAEFQQVSPKVPEQSGVVALPKTAAVSTAVVTVIPREMADEIFALRAGMESLRSTMESLRRELEFSTTSANARVERLENQLQEARRQRGSESSWGQMSDCSTTWDSRR